VPWGTLPLFAGKDSSLTAFSQQGRQRVVTAEEFVGIASGTPDRFVPDL
jgi:hypothetical protein